MYPPTGSYLEITTPKINKVLFLFLKKNIFPQDYAKGRMTQYPMFFILTMIVRIFHLKIS